MFVTIGGLAREGKGGGGARLQIRRVLGDESVINARIGCKRRVAATAHLGCVADKNHTAGSSPANVPDCTAMKD